MNEDDLPELAKQDSISINKDNADDVLSQIIFSDGPYGWVMKITNHEGILFNREKYPDAKPDDFALAVIEILENQFMVKFERAMPPYDRSDIQSRNMQK